MDDRLEVVRYEQALRSEDACNRLKAHALGAVLGLVPATLAVFFGVTRRLELDGAILLQTDRPDIQLDDEWARWEADVQAVDPFSPRRMAATGATVVTLDDLQPGQGEELLAYLGRMRVTDRAMIYLRCQGTLAAVVVLLRSDGMPRFSRAEVMALRRLHPLVEHAYHFAEMQEEGEPSSALTGAGLTTREAEVAELVGKGATNAEIANALCVSQATVKTHLTRIYTKLGVRGRTQLALVVGDRAAPLATTFG